EVSMAAETRNDMVFVRDRREYAAAMRTAIRLEGGPGDLMYWPASYWHMAVGGGELNVSLAMGIRRTKPRFLRNLTHRYLDAGQVWTSEDIQGRDCGAGERNPSPALLGCLRRLPRGPVGARMHADALESWLQFLTAGGLDPGPTLDGQGRRLVGSDRV